MRGAGVCGRGVRRSARTKGSRGAVSGSCRGLVPGAVPRWFGESVDPAECFGYLESCPVCFLEGAGFSGDQVAKQPACPPVEGPGVVR